MGQWTQEAVLQFRNARRDLEQDRLNAALDEATQAYAAFQIVGDLEGMAECVRIVSHALSRQGLRKQAVQMATEELQKCREKNQKRAEALMLLTLAEIKLNFPENDAREEACHLANQARMGFSNLKDRKMEGESCLANGNALLKSSGSRTEAAEAFRHARQIFQSLQSPSLEGRALHGLACCSAAGGSFTRAIEEAKGALTCFEQCNNNVLQVSVLDAISRWQLESGELRLAHHFAEQSLGLAQQTSSLTREAQSLRSFVRVLVQEGDAASVLGNCHDAVSRYRDVNAREAESIALAALVECLVASQESLDRSLQAATDACIAFRELGDLQQEMEMCCTMTRLCLDHEQLDQAEDYARRALQLAGRDDRLAKSEALGLWAEVLLAKPDGAEKAVSLLKKEQMKCQDSRDELGEALTLLSLANAYMELSKPKEVLASAESARKLFKTLGDKMGELSALQITADVHARAMRYSDMSSALEKALDLAQVLGDNVTEASLNISFAQAQMGLLEISQVAPGTADFRDSGEAATKAAKKAVALARRGQRSDLIISALCALSQTQFLVGEKQAARSAAKAATSLAKGQPLSQATALVLAANSCITLGKMEAAKEAAGNALYLFEGVKDYVGQDLAKATLDAIGNPVSAVTTGKMRRIVRKRKNSVNAEALRQKVRNVVSEIVGMDALQDDTPLMQSGLTSQSAVLLRNALSTEIPGSSLPFTLMFDYPSISDLSAFFVDSAGGEEEEVEEWVEDTTAGLQVAQVRTGPNPEELRKQVRDVVAEIVGMEDLVDDTPLMQAGLTSQSAVLLRNSLSKELPGASLPFTMMFDYPSVNALTDFFVARSGPSEVDGPMIMYEAEAGTVSKGGSSLDPQVTQRQVRHIVEEIVGMDDFTDDDALMQHGIHSHNAVLLRDALRKEFQGPNMPHTLIFDYPSVMDLTEYIVERAQK